MIKDFFASYLVYSQIFTLFGGHLWRLKPSRYISFSKLKNVWNRKADLQWRVVVLVSSITAGQERRSARAKQAAAAYASWRVQCQHVVIRLPPHGTSHTHSEPACGPQISPAGLCLCLFPIRLLNPSSPETAWTRSTRWAIYKTPVLILWDK
jgi:hypothetical protein